MPIKRPRDLYDTPESTSPPRIPPAKRRNTETPLPASSPFPSSSSVYGTPRTPYAYAIPSDSPTNPFGRIRKFTACAELPKETSFGKHLPLRFQLVRPTESTSTNGRMLDKDGIYRVVQVPLNYTVRHLHKLVLYLFRPPTAEELAQSRNSRRSLRPRESVIPFLRPKRENVPPKQSQIFEIQRRVRCDEVYKPGEVRKGKTWVKLSSGPDLRRNSLDPDDESDGPEREDDDGKEWRWGDQDDYTLGDVWPVGGDLSKAIIYHHNSSVQVHVTMNTKPIPPRKGVGNKPFVFLAYGDLDLDNPDNTLCLEKADPIKWNRLNGFINFLKEEAERDREARTGCHLEDEHEQKEASFDASSTSLPVFSSSPNRFSPFTPFPTGKRHRMRVDYAHKRMARLTRLSMDETEPSDEEDGNDEQDELADDDENDDTNFKVKEEGREWDSFWDEEELM